MAGDDAENRINSIPSRKYSALTMIIINIFEWMHEFRSQITYKVYALYFLILLHCSLPPHTPCIRHAISNVFRLYFCFLFARFFSCHLRDWPNHWFGSSCVANATMKIHPSRQTCRRQPNNNNNNQSLSERIYFRRQWARARRLKVDVALHFGCIRPTQKQIIRRYLCYFQYFSAHYILLLQI